MMNMNTLKRLLVVAGLAFAVSAPAYAGSSFSISVGNGRNHVHYSENNYGRYDRRVYDYRYERPAPRYRQDVRVVEYYRYDEPVVRQQVYQYNYPAAPVCVARAQDGRLYEYYC